MYPKVTIEVNGRRWQQVRSLAKSGPDDRRYMVETTAGITTVIFGDGINGAIPPTGSNVQATYRYGSGAAGNVGVSYRVPANRTPDQAIWVVIRNGTNAISFERRKHSKRK